MMWKPLIGFVGVLFFFFLLMRTRKHWGKTIEWLSIFWFRIAFAFVLLFVLHYSLGFVGLFVPINFFSGLLVTLLGVPGVASVLAISIYYNFF
ncbi:pro-sigmaK processing inhibitor BofA family protein [Viridibacillus sp. YIM B01967]|uniref:Pro-sigmaK processing inhibitor BofA family protein n=1 Tax=Viridibacillus soli TaxID=2798301 RepID=A0ABS1HDY3_9BACL|nr:pro-sigmaK processing inhibitor BofA family protein [Viridibacillus soli]MBK3497307.1 pro-sigmaK processing inhibitor BofA family protein [Viridibacillus soli]